MSAPLEQISKVANLMLVLTLVTGTVVVSLLLCMWMRTRQKEVAIFMRLGKTKSEIFLQTLLEAGSVFTPVSYTHLDVYKRQIYYKTKKLLLQSYQKSLKYL